jgi:hypothetical protein
VGNPGNLRKSIARKSPSISYTSKEKEKALEEKVEQAKEELKIEVEVEDFKEKVLYNAETRYIKIEKEIETIFPSTLSDCAD